eukprot:16758-Prymnesium_polylepis.1
MGRPKKSKIASRSNGGKSTNKGKLLHGVPVVVRDAEQEDGKRPAAAAGVAFKTVFRAKLPKNVNYLDELRDKELLEAAVQ